MIGLRLGTFAPGTDTTFHELFSSPPFIVLAEDEHASISGVAGPLWSRSPKFVELGSPREFTEFDGRHSMRGVLLSAVIEDERGSRIVSEIRAHCHDRYSWVRFRPAWALLAPVTHFIGSEPLRAATRLAEGAHPPHAPASGR